MPGIQFPIQFKSWVLLVVVPKPETKIPLCEINYNYAKMTKLRVPLTPIYIQKERISNRVDV